MNAINRFKNQELRIKMGRIIPENFGFGVWIWYTNENRLLLSEGFYNMIGVSKDVYPTFDLLIGCIHPDDLEGFVNMMEIMLQGLHPRWLRFRVVQPDRSTQKIQCYVEVMRAELAGIFDIVGLCFEINE